MTRADFETKHGMSGLSNATGYLDAMRVFDHYEAQLVEKDARIAALESASAFLQNEGVEQRKRIAELERQIVGWAEIFTANTNRIAELEAENAELAKHKPKFEVGDMVEVFWEGAWEPAMFRGLNIRGDIERRQGTVYGLQLAHIRLPQPKVTKPTADEWYEAFCGEQNGDFKEMVKLARRHEAKQTEEAK